MTGIAGQVLTVAVKCVAACEACAGREGCGIAGLPAKQVRIKVDNPQNYRVGQRVSLRMKPAAVGLSLFFAFVLPTIVVAVVLAVALFFGADETAAAVGGLGAAAVYALFLWLINFWLERRLKIIVE